MIWIIGVIAIIVFIWWFYNSNKHFEVLNKKAFNELKEMAKYIKPNNDVIRQMQILKNILRKVGMEEHEKIREILILTDILGCMSTDITLLKLYADKNITSQEIKQFKNHCLRRLNMDPDVKLSDTDIEFIEKYEIEFVMGKIMAILDKKN